MVRLLLVTIGLATLPIACATNLKCGEGTVQSGDECVRAEDADTAVARDSGTDTDSGGASGADNCSVDAYSVCIEFEGYGETANWCSAFASHYDVGTDYSTGTCEPRDVIGMCEVPASPFNDFEHAATVYYYGDGFTTGSARSACEGGGGTWLDDL